MSEFPSVSALSACPLCQPQDHCPGLCARALGWLAQRPDRPHVVKLTPFLLRSLDCCPDWPSLAHAQTRACKRVVDGLTGTQLWGLMHAAVCGGDAFIEKSEGIKSPAVLLCLLALYPTCIWTCLLYFKRGVYCTVSLAAVFVCTSHTIGLTSPTSHSAN